MFFVFQDPAPPYASFGYRPLFFAKYAADGHKKNAPTGARDGVAIAVSYRMEVAWFKAA